MMEMKNIAAALISANKAFKTPAQSGLNTHLRNKYSTIADYLNAVNHALWDNNLFLTQNVKSVENVVNVTTRITHISGEYLESDATSIPIEKPNAQAVGSAIAYARRYSLAAFLSLAAGTEEDDDGESASHTTEKRAAKEVYEESRFQQMLPGWTERIKSGKANPDTIIGMVEAKYQLTREQKDAIRHAASVDEFFEGVPE